MNFFKRFGITFANKKNKYLPEAKNTINEQNVFFVPNNENVYKTLATFDLKIESPKYEGAIPEATIKFYPLK